MRSIQNSAGDGRIACPCDHPQRDSRQVVLTGGPGAGKTAVLNLVRQRLCRHVYVVEESASILFGGGFPRNGDGLGQRAAQRAIYHVQLELERVAHSRPQTILAVCDRGTLDGLAYWPGDSKEFCAELDTSIEAELARYSVVIHMRTPPAAHYNHDNHLRLESSADAMRIDDAIEEAWAGHPMRLVIESHENFMRKAELAMELIERELRVVCPRCCVA